MVRELEVPTVWNDPPRAQELGRERAQLERIVATLGDLGETLAAARELAELAAAEDDHATFAAVQQDLQQLEARLADLEFRRMFAGEMDINNAFLDVQSGSGGTEAQDWANMLLRMYLRWGERHGFKTELVDCSPGDVAGIKSATIRFEGDHPRLMIASRSISIPPICGSIPTVPAGRVASTSTAPSRQFVLPISPLESWCSVRATARNTKTALRR
ncbi:MAG: hypothetical protein FD130_299 [Halothiobacillaceae bacterium]|nr:MAG: hypothetical protein FD130_299 [Halothiobacillaceae bacterium]